MAKKAPIGKRRLKRRQYSDEMKAKAVQMFRGIGRREWACKVFCVTVAEARYLPVSSGMRPSYITAK